MKKFLNQKEHALKIISFKKKKMGLLITKQQESYEDAKICDICKEKIENKYLKNIIQLEIILIIQGNIEVPCIAYLI